MRVIKNLEWIACKLMQSIKATSKMLHIRGRIPCMVASHCRTHISKRLNHQRNPALMRTLRLLLLGTAISLSLFGQASAGNRVQKIVVFGDSLSAAYGIPQSAGWVQLLQRRLQQQRLPYQVVNASISGETTSGGLSRFEAMLRTHQPAIVVLELGANDGLRGLNLTDTTRNLDTMVRQAQQQGAQVCLLGMKIPPNYGLKYSQQFSDLFVRVAQQHQLMLVPFFLEDVGGNPAMTQSDGLHPTAAAQPQLLENVWPYLSRLL